ncbi:MAG: hypothetical protein HKN46_00475 [Acidimicrobiia bacterium]|nr:hypothetical protein [Acidimicrobiia bacterium]
MTLHALPDTFARTRRSLHLLHFYALSYARQQSDGEVWLSPSPSGITTPPFGGRALRVEGTHLIEEVDGTEVRRAPITTLRAALGFAGVEFDRARGKRNDIEVPVDLDEVLAVDEVAVDALAEWFLLGERVLTGILDSATDADQTAIRLWGEHFDLAIETGSEERRRRASVGFAPGDEHIAEPYAYVAPWWKDDVSDLLGDTESFGGVAMRYSELVGVVDPDAAAHEFLARVLGALAA